MHLKLFISGLITVFIFLHEKAVISAKLCHFILLKSLTTGWKIVKQFV